MAFAVIPESMAAPEIPAGSEVACVITNIGDGISAYTSRFFAEGDFVRGMLANAFADTYLFEMEKSWSPQLIAACRERGVGIARRLEVPDELPMEAQRLAFEAIGAGELPGMRLSDAYMFYPVKTVCQIFLLTDQKDVFEVAHNCRRCRNAACNMREVLPATVEVHGQGEIFFVTCCGEERILDALRRERQGFTAVCGGQGRCGKCRVRVRSGDVPPTKEDRAFFSSGELEAGFRLACRAYPRGDCVIELLSSEEAFEVLTESADTAVKDAAASGLGIAVDIGTTTIAAQLVELPGGQVQRTAVSLNHQRDFGADVISRIQASNEGKGPALQQRIRDDLCRVIGELLEDGADAGRLRQICIAGNTTMGHLLLGYSCETMGRLPFRPYNIKEVRGSAREILGGRILEHGVRPDLEVCLLPGISAFVGADITAGLLHCGFDRQEKPCFFLDLGTNGEMALGGCERIYVTSTAAGPAFEGGNIRWGRGSVPGAISQVEILPDETCRVQTIGGQTPAGICGTGLIAASAELLRCGLMDETGRLTERYLASGYPLAETADGEQIVLTQRDIRELQTAKAAIRAGIEILMKKYGADYGELDQVFLAGGFGWQISQEQAAAIGLLPAQFLGRIRTVGNSALAGARLYLTSPQARTRAERLRAASTELLLGAEPDFQEYYVSGMYFEEE